MILQLFIFLICLPLSTSARPPHILFIVADDFGWNDIGYHQNQKSSANPLGHPTTNPAAGILPTPILDQLALEAVKLENYYVQPLCSPTRSTIMTGRYPFHTGIGPDVIVIPCPYGVPAREVFMPELLRSYGYATHMIGKWHLGACDERYLPNFRGFDSYIGYLSGGQGYYNQAGDRNGTGEAVLPRCMGSEFKTNYSSVLWAHEARRIALNHAQMESDKPLFLYLAFQSVHNPYDVPPASVVGNVNETFSEIYEYERRIYAGMVKALDIAVGNVTQAFKDAGLWSDTVLVFTTDNGGIGVGNNYPLRGSKVLNWEGGIKGVAFVRGTDSQLAPLPSNIDTVELMHSTDWLPTLCRLAGHTDPNTTLPLDGFDQWDVLLSGTKTKRTMVLHNIPVGSIPVNVGNASHPIWSTSMCFNQVDNRTGPCHGFGQTGGAIRLGDFKLLTTFNGSHPWGDSSPTGVGQGRPGGRYSNGSHVFIPVTNDTVPAPYLGTYWLFNITQDPTETKNLAEIQPKKLKEMLDLYNKHALTAVPNLAWRYGFYDPQWRNNPDESRNPLTVDIGNMQEDFERGGCTGPFLESQYCPYGHEFECSVHGEGLEGGDVGTPVTDVPDLKACRRACLNDTTNQCQWWVYRSQQKICHFKSSKGSLWSCSDCYYGPKHCPGWDIPPLTDYMAH